MEFIVEKIGMSRTIATQSIPVTLLRVLKVKVCALNENESAIVAYSDGKSINKSVTGQQKKFGLSAEFNRFATLEKVANKEAGDLDVSSLESAKILQITFKSKGRGFSGLIKRHGFAGGPAAHGSRFHRTSGSIGNREWPGRVQKGRKMAGHYGNETVSVKNSLVSFDASSGILVVKGSVSGANGVLGRVRIVK
ncbi:MAG: 50S ribosomal protein L3 [Campylobacteraceae bacterium]|jgi:large subunit ribosomal protein L3|nr:50S ribosomal protein L3 [Campylobacteraceae bacterium]